MHDNFYYILKALEQSYPDPPILTTKIKSIFHEIRSKGNDAVHEFAGDKGDALHLLRLTRDLAVWYQKSYGIQTVDAFGAFIPPPNPYEIRESFEKQLDKLKESLTNVETDNANLVIELETANRLAEEAKSQFAEYMTTIENLVDTDNFDLNSAQAIALEEDKNIKSQIGELLKIFEIKCYSEGYNAGRQKRTKLTDLDFQNINRIRSKYSDKNIVDMTETIFSEYNDGEWCQHFIETRVGGYIFKGFRITIDALVLFDMNLKDLELEDVQAEIFFQYMQGYVDGLL